MPAMNVESLWPPQRAARRVARRAKATGFQMAAERYQRSHPGAPWMPQPAIEILSDMLRSTDRCLEWGSGASTTWLSDRCASIVSVEHDPGWYQRVRDQLTASGSDPASVRLLGLEPTDVPAESPYVRAVDEFAHGELDVCFVDGEHRAACVLEAIPRLASNGLLIVDDAQSFLDHPSRCISSRAGRGPLDDDWRQISELLSDWRLIWVGDGYSDAATWVKP
jgi:predicted O-methyltransferase YrrM